MELKRTPKILWYDSETTGLDPESCALVQIGAIVEVAGEVKEEVNIQIAPHSDAVIEDGAADLLGPSVAEGAAPKLAFEQFTSVLNFYVNKFERLDKFILAGYNIAFDDQFLRSFFKRNKDKYFGSYFAWPKLDVATFVSLYFAEMSFRPKDFKLATLCPLFGIDIDAHDALSDIRATRELYRVLRYTLAPTPSQAKAVAA